MKKTGLVPFVSGVLSTALIFGQAATALAPHLHRRDSIWAMTLFRDKKILC